MSALSTVAKKAVRTPVMTGRLVAERAIVSFCCGYDQGIRQIVILSTGHQWKGLPGMADGTENGASAAAWRQVRNTRASEDVLAQIKEAFFGGMKAGDWLGTETELAERFGVSRITVRDAIRSLEAQ